MPAPSSHHQLSATAARRLWLRAQRLDAEAPFGAGPAAVAAAVAHLGYVQIDTINVIERCHHHILFSRIPAYRRAELRQAQSADKTVFEYWTHALSYVPVQDFRYFVPAMRRYRREGHGWFKTVKPEDTRKVMRLVRQGGALTIRDIDDDVLREKDHAWASRKPSKRALQLGFYEGVLTVSGRDGMLKTYDLTTRHFGWERLPKGASEREIATYLLDRGLRAQGVVSLDSLCHLNAARKSDVRRVIDGRVRRGELVPVALETLANQTIKSASVKGADINAGIINPIQNFADVIAEARLDEADAKAWYLMAAKGTDTIEVAYLNGVDTPYIDQQEGFTTDGIATKVRIDAGVAPLDYRGLVKSSGQ